MNWKPTGINFGIYTMDRRISNIMYCYINASHSWPIERNSFSNQVVDSQEQFNFKGI